MKTKNYCLSIRDAENGFIVEESFYEGEKDDREWKDLKHIFPNWDGVVEFIKTHEIKE